MTTPTPTSSPAQGAARAQAEPRESYVDRDGFDPEEGYEIEVASSGDHVSLALGETRRSGGFSEDAWAVLTIAEARELAGDLNRLANEAEVALRRKDSQEPTR